MNLDTGAAIHTGPTAPLVLKPHPQRTAPIPFLSAEEAGGGE